MISRRLLKPEDYPNIKTELSALIISNIEEDEVRNEEDEIVIETYLGISIQIVGISWYFYRAQTLQFEIEIENAIQAFVRHNVNEMKKLQMYFQ